MLNRRLALKSFGLAAAALATPAWAQDECRPSPWGPVCRAGVDFTEFHQEAFDTQHRSQWCWAACISMVFAFHGHRVRQQRIVREAYGAPVNMPAPGFVIARQLQRRWTDDDGEVFSVRVNGLYDAQFGIHATSNARIVDALRHERPLIIGARGHAVVLTMAEYQPGPMGPVVRAAGVFDPWPGRGARGLMPDELVPVHQGGSLQFVVGIDVV